MTKTNIRTFFGALALIVSLMGFAIFSPITPNVSAACDPSDLSAQSGADCSTTEDQPADLFGEDGVFKVITNVALFLIGAISVLMLIYGGIKYVLSGGESGAVTSAKNTILYAVVGIIVALLAAAIVNFVLSTFVAK